LKKIFTKALCALLTLCSLAPCLYGCTGKQKYSSYEVGAFDSFVLVIAYTENKREFDRINSFIGRELEKYHKYYDIYNSYEGINNLCTLNSLTDGQHTEQKLADEIIDLLLFAKEMHSLTDGLVNIAMGSVLSLWHKSRTEKLAPPAREELLSAAEHTDISDLVIDSEAGTAFIADPQMTLDVGAIAKGYAVERIAASLEEMGVSDLILNVGGNVRTLGRHSDGRRWSAGIHDPSGEAEYLETVYLEDLSLVTSGSYQRFYSYEGQSYHHIIDPTTLFPAENFVSVSVICRDSGLADALSTALFLMEPNKALSFISSLEGAEALFLCKDGKKLYSKGFGDCFKKQK